MKKLDTWYVMNSVKDYDVVVGWKDIVRYVGMSRYRIEKCRYPIHKEPFVWASKSELDAHTNAVFIQCAHIHRDGCDSS